MSMVKWERAIRFVLEPIYKIFAHCLGEEKEDLAQTLAEAGSFCMPP